MRSARAWSALAALSLVACANPGLEGSGSLPELADAARLPARLVLVSVAGMGVGQTRAEPGAPASMPTVAALGRAGARAAGVDAVAPATSYPAHATLVTGRLPAHHGITADRVLGAHGSESRRATPRPALRTPALWDAVADSGRRSVALGWPGSNAGRIDLVFPERFELAPDVVWKDWIESHLSPGLLEPAMRRGAADPSIADDGPARDRLLVGLACDVLGSSTPPALLLVHLSQAAPALAAAGPDSERAATALASTDSEIARLVDCLRDEGFLESSAILVVGSHGASSVDTAVHPNVLLREAGLVVPASDSRAPARWTAWVSANGGSGLVHARGEDDARLARRALEALAARSGAFRIVAARELLARGADREAWFGLEAAEGFWIGEAIDAPLLAPAPVRAGWGSLEGAAAPGFVAWGRGLRSGTQIDTLRQVDVAPTVARLLGFEIGELDGAPVAGLLGLPAVAAARDAADEETSNGP